MKNRTVIFADDHHILLEGLVSMAESNGMEVLGTAPNGEEVLKLIHSKGAPDYLVLDIEMPGGKDGITTAAILKKKYPHLKIVILSMHKEKEFIRKTLQTGVNAYVLKDSGSHEILQAFEALEAGKSYIDAKMSASLLQEDNDAAHPLLSPREIEIIRLIAEQQTTSQIATQLHLSKHTVETHRKNILFKLELKNSAGLVKYAIKNGII
ncbi:response regulator [Saccharicrinis sp. GN24d3]|uniref:response regulator n=1 Tax=Saccharicrinis sp. GN24d3 TaxID=3458416 RepID=UPI004036A35B